MLWSCLRWKKVKDIVARKEIPASSSFETASSSRHLSHSGGGGRSISGASGTPGRPVLEWEGVSHWPEPVPPQKGEKGKG